MRVRDIRKWENPVACFCWNVLITISSLPIYLITLKPAPLARYIALRDLSLIASGTATTQNRTSTTPIKPHRSNRPGNTLQALSDHSSESNLRHRSKSLNTQTQPSNQFNNRNVLLPPTPQHSHTSTTSHNPSSRNGGLISKPPD